MKLKLLIVFLICSVALIAQETARDISYWEGIDTMQINQVDVIEKRQSFYSSTEHKDDLDTTLLRAYGSTDLSYLLAKSSLVNIINYGGNGSQSTVNIRGGSSSHTSVFWNGIPINSLTTGGADLSMINAGGFDNVSVIYGASGAMYGSGTFGGAILLDNNHTFEKRKEASVGLEYASFSNKRARLSGKFANSNLSYSGQVFYLDGKNNFTFKDVHEVGHPIDTMRNAENVDFGTIHSLGLNLNGHRFTAGLWYQIKDYNIGGKMGFGPPISYQNQKDSTLKTFVGYNYLLNKVRFELQTAYVSDFLRYTDKDPISDDWKIFSEIGSKRWLNTFSVRYYWLECFNIDAQLKYNKLKGEVTAYREDKNEDEANFVLAGQYVNDLLTLNLSLSKEWNSETSPPMVYNIGALINVIPKTLLVSGKYATYYRRPTFNERYWVPGGNPDLEAEMGYGYEAGLKFQKNIDERSAISSYINYYHSVNDQMIIWVDEDGHATPQNTNKVLAKGLETSMDYSWVGSNSSINIAVKYAYNSTVYNDKDLGNYYQDLAYKPNHIVRSSAIYSRSKWEMGLSSSYQSKMYSVDGQEMDAFFLMDTFGKYNLRIVGIDASLSLKVNNILSEDYQVIYAYPMPQRNYSIAINIKL